MISLEMDKYMKDIYDDGLSLFDMISERMDNNITVNEFRIAVRKAGKEYGIAGDILTAHGWVSLDDIVKIIKENKGMNI